MNYEGLHLFGGGCYYMSPLLFGNIEGSLIGQLFDISFDYQKVFLTVFDINNYNCY